MNRTVDGDAAVNRNVTVYDVPAAVPCGSAAGDRGVARAALAVAIFIQIGDAVGQCRPAQGQHQPQHQREA